MKNPLFEENPRTGFPLAATKACGGLSAAGGDDPLPFI
jgi:hypothetical protein